MRSVVYTFIFFNGWRQTFVDGDWWNRQLRACVNALLEILAAEEEAEEQKRQQQNEQKAAQLGNPPLRPGGDARAKG